MEFKRDQRVVDAYDHTHVGEVVEVIDRLTTLRVKWDDGSMGRYYPSELAPYDPEGDRERAILAQAKIDEATHSLEACFAALRAAHQIETGSECDEGFHRLRNNKLLNMKDFEEVVIANGWSASSIYC